VRSMSMCFSPNLPEQLRTRYCEINVYVLSPYLPVPLPVQLRARYCEINVYVLSPNLPVPLPVQLRTRYGTVRSMSTRAVPQSTSTSAGTAEDQVL
jgi:hypothetical protein